MCNLLLSVSYLTYNAFSSYAPVYDSTTANISKEDSDLLLSTYMDETGLQYAKRLHYTSVPFKDYESVWTYLCLCFDSIQEFVENCSNDVTCMVDHLLNMLTDHDHAKTKQMLNPVRSGKKN